MFTVIFPRIATTGFSYSKAEQRKTIARYRRNHKFHRTQKSLSISALKHIQEAHPVLRIVGKRGTPCVELLHETKEIA